MCTMLEGVVLPPDGEEDHGLNAGGPGSVPAEVAWQRGQVPADAGPRADLRNTRVVSLKTPLIWVHIIKNTSNMSAHHQKLE